MTDILIVCQGQAQTRRGNTLFGWWSDVPLSSLGRRQSLLLAGRLQTDFQVTALYTSPLRRATEMADLIADQVKVVPQQRADLRELDCASLEGLSYKEAYAKFPDLVLHGPSASGHGVESYGQFQVRVATSIRSIIRENKGGCVVVTHGGPIVAYLRHVLGHTSGENEPGPYFETAPASVHALCFESQIPTVIRLNDVSHLADGPN